MKRNYGAISAHPNDAQRRANWRVRCVDVEQLVSANQLACREDDRTAPPRRERGRIAIELQCGQMHGRQKRQP